MLSAPEIIAKGFSGKRVGEIIKMSKNWTEDEKKSFLESGIVPERKENRFIVDENSVLRWMIEMETFLPPSSNSEKKRMLDNQCVMINGRKCSHDDTIPPLIESFVLFPENETKRCTLL
jgi:hypothetical protein